jgi:hypothetical protein
MLFHIELAFISFIFLMRLGGSDHQLEEQAARARLRTTLPLRMTIRDESVGRDHC